MAHILPTGVEFIKARRFGASTGFVALWRDAQGVEHQSILSYVPGLLKPWQYGRPGAGGLDWWLDPPHKIVWPMDPLTGQQVTTRMLE